jgi:tRNA/rRNA methyltransferase
MGFSTLIFVMMSALFAACTIPFSAICSKPIFELLMEYERKYGLTDLRLVRPRPDWQVERARKAAAGAQSLIDNRAMFDTVAEATADLGFVVATTARLRDMVKPVMTPVHLGQQMRTQATETGTKSGVLFGPERTGLDNDDISLADAICRVPLNPDFSSLNLAQAVLLIGYEWFQTADATPSAQLPVPDTRPANRAELHGMFSHFEAALDAAGFLAPPEKKPAMARNLRNMFHRASLTEQDVRTFRGVINALLRWPRGADDRIIKPRVAAISKGEPDPGAADDTPPADDGA